MKTKLLINGSSFVLENYLSPSRTIVTVGKESNEAFNVITTDDKFDVFQCQLTRTDKGWLLRNGQWRTECPRGILSRLQHACQMCLGRCVNLRTANPKYSWRFPKYPTLLNGTIVPEAGVVISDGDVISIKDDKSDFFITICFEV